jgi:hypothetical protein
VALLHERENLLCTFTNLYDTLRRNNKSSIVFAVNQPQVLLICDETFRDAMSAVMTDCEDPDCCANSACKASPLKKKTRVKGGGCHTLKTETFVHIEVGASFSVGSTT